MGCSSLCQGGICPQGTMGGIGGGGVSLKISFSLHCCPKGLGFCREKANSSPDKRGEKKSLNTPKFAAQIKVSWGGKRNSAWKSKGELEKCSSTPQNTSEGEKDQKKTQPCRNIPTLVPKGQPLHRGMSKRQGNLALVIAVSKGLQARAQPGSKKPMSGWPSFTEGI